MRLKDGFFFGIYRCFEIFGIYGIYKMCQFFLGFMKFSRDFFQKSTRCFLSDLPIREQVTASSLQSSLGIGLGPIQTILILYPIPG